MPATIVVPCYNEEQRLDLSAFAGFLERHPQGFRFLFVNDGSTDGTVPKIEAFTAGHPQASLLDLPRNGGKAEAVRAGMLAALEQGCDFVGYFDADLATPLRELPSFLAPLHEYPDLDIVLGSRVRLLGRKIQRQPIRHYLGRVFATTVSLLLRLPVYDTQCGAKMFRANERLRSILQVPFTTSWIFDVELLVRYLQAGGRDTQLYELPLQEWRDVAGSKVRHRDFVRAGMQLLRLVRRYKLYRRP